jgi:hypothetical protein
VSDSVEAHPSREVRSGTVDHTIVSEPSFGWEEMSRAIGHMTAPEPTAAGRRDPGLWDT